MQYLISRLKLVVNVSIEGKGNFHLGHAILANFALEAFGQLDLLGNLIWSILPFSKFSSWSLENLKYLAIGQYDDLVELAI